MTSQTEVLGRKAFAVVVAAVVLFSALAPLMGMASVIMS